MIACLAGIATIVIGAWQFEGWLQWIFIIIGIGLLCPGSSPKEEVYKKE